MLKTLCTTAIGVAVALALPAAGTATMQMTFAKGDVQVTGATPGSTVALSGTIRERSAWVTTCDAVHESLVDPSGSSAYVYSPNPSNAFAGTVPDVRRSLWVAVDGTTGETVVGAPEAQEAIESQAVITPIRSPQGWQLEIDEQDVEVMLVRPGVGAWAGRFSDGGPRDVGLGSDGKVKFLVQDLAPIDARNGASAPSRPQRDDVIVVVENQMLTYRVSVMGSLR